MSAVSTNGKNYWSLQTCWIKEQKKLSKLMKATVQSSDGITDMLVGLSDGLTVPFAITAGLSAAMYKILISFSILFYYFPKQDLRKTPCSGAVQMVRIMK